MSKENPADGWPASKPMDSAAWPVVPEYRVRAVRAWIQEHRATARPLPCAAPLLAILCALCAAQRYERPTRRQLATAIYATTGDLVSAGSVGGAIRAALREGEIHESEGCLLPSEDLYEIFCEAIPGKVAREMQNDRPIEDANLQAGLDEIKAIMLARGLAGAAMLVAPEEAAFTVGMHAPWSALRPGPTSPLGFRFRAITAETGKAETEKRVENAMHTICQLCDFGYMLASHMEDLMTMLRKAGIDFTHMPYGGQPLGRLVSGNPAQRPRDRRG